MRFSEIGRLLEASGEGIDDLVAAIEQLNGAIRHVKDGPRKDELEAIADNLAAATLTITENNKLVAVCLAKLLSEAAFTPPARRETPGGK